MIQPNKILRFFFSLIIILSIFGTAYAGRKKLSIDSVTQESPLWCWLAVGEMVFKHYEVPSVNSDYQCGIIGALAYNAGNLSCDANCRNCSMVSAGNYQGILNMLKIYPPMAYKRNNEAVDGLTVRYNANSLTREQVKKEIDADRPIIAGISPSGYPVNYGTRVASEHAILIIGYDESDSDFTLTVNDPYPYSSTDPYTKAGGDSNGDGSYDIDINTLKNTLKWRESFSSIMLKSELAETSVPSEITQFPVLEDPKNLKPSVMSDGLTAESSEFLKINLQTKTLPEKFYGHNPVQMVSAIEKISEEYNKYKSQRENEGKVAVELSQFIKGKKILGNLTVDDFFAFLPKFAGYITGGGDYEGDKTGTNASPDYKGRLFRLRRISEFPEPYFDGQYTTVCKGIVPEVKRPLININRPGEGQNQLVTPFTTQESLDDIWKRSIFNLKTVLPEETISIPQNLDENSFRKFCQQLTLQTPQTHYSIGFTKRQPFPLIKVQESYFSSENYQGKVVEGKGIVAWQPGMYARRKEGKMFFIAKLVPPYVTKSTQTTTDSRTRKMHTAISYRLFVELTEIWFRDDYDGEISSKYKGILN